MPTKIQLKRSSVAGKAPTAGQLDVGELAVNLTDKKIYTKNASGSVVEILGSVGPQGPAGATGPQGPAGVAGATGATGATGPAGATGATGPAGANGEKWFTGTTTPSAGTGANGDLYLNTTTGDVYEKAGGVWGSPIANIQGPAGPAGASGSGSGDVTGPASSGNNHVALFNGTTGKVIKDSAVSLSDLATIGHIHDDRYYTETEVDTFLAFKADTSSLATVATSGAYSDLSGKPSLATVATSGSYNDLTSKPTIPTVPTAVSAFTNDSGYLVASDLSPYLTSSSASSTYQPLDADLSAIGGLSGTSGFLKKTAANTWTLDTSTYLTSYTETDPIFVASAAYGITGTKISNWDTAYGWGNHASAGYLTSATAASTYLTSGAASTTYAPISTTVTLTGTQTVTGKTLTTVALYATKVAVSASAIDLATGNYFTKTISGATTFTVSNTPSTGTTASFILDLTNGGSATITWWSGMKWAAGTAPTLTSAGRDVLGFFTHDGGTTWTGLVLGKDVK